MLLKYKIKQMFIITSLLLVVFLVAACSNNAPKIELNTNYYDMGDIDPDKGLWEETFSIKNTGGSTLKILSISTSCGCTSAEAESTELAPGEETKLLVTYDPSQHPGTLGEIRRMVYIQSNDPVNKEVELELVGNSLPSDNNEEGHMEDMHMDDLAEFEISPHELFDKINEDASFKLLDVREDFEYEENHIDEPFLLSVDIIDQEQLDELGFDKDDEIVVYCRSGKRSARAYEILTDLGYTNVKSLNGGIIHWIEEGYPVKN